MAYSKKTWVNRVSEHPARRKLTATGTADVYDVSREEGIVTAAGDAFSESTMNDLENRVETGINAVQSTADSATTTANAALPKSGGTLTGVVTAGGAQAIGTAQIRNSYATTTDLIAGTTSLSTGTIALVYV